MDNCRISEFKNSDIKICENTTVWKYQSFEKTISMFDSGLLFFSRVDKLNDDLEGKFPLNNLINLHNEHPLDPIEERIDAENILKLQEWYRNNTHVNSWYIGDKESLAMWKLYSNNTGVVLKSSIKKIKSAYQDRFKIHYGKIQYLDFNDYDDETGINRIFPASDIERLFFIKDFSFKHENEFRLIFHLENGDFDPISNSLHENGLHLNFDLNILIDEVRVFPNAPNWIINTLKSIRNRCEYNHIPILRSHTEIYGRLNKLII